MEALLYLKISLFLHSSLHKLYELVSIGIYAQSWSKSTQSRSEQHWRSIKYLFIKIYLLFIQESFIWKQQQKPASKFHFGSFSSLCYFILVLIKCCYFCCSLWTGRVAKGTKGNPMGNAWQKGQGALFLGSVYKREQKRYAHHVLFIGG